MHRLHLKDRLSVFPREIIKASAGPAVGAQQSQVSHTHTHTQCHTAPEWHRDQGQTDQSIALLSSNSFTVDTQLL